MDELDFKWWYFKQYNTLLHGIGLTQKYEAFMTDQETVEVVAQKLFNTHRKTLDALGDKHSANQ